MSTRSTRNVSRWAAALLVLSAAGWVNPRGAFAKCAIPSDPPLETFTQSYKIYTHFYPCVDVHIGSRSLISHTGAVGADLCNSTTVGGTKLRLLMVYPSAASKMPSDGKCVWRVQTQTYSNVFEFGLRLNGLPFELTADSMEESAPSEDEPAPAANKKGDAAGSD